MRKFLGTLAMAVMAVAVVGGMRSWFTVQKSDHGDSMEVHLLINREKIRTDTANARDIARELRENLGRKIEKKLDASAPSQPKIGVPLALPVLPMGHPSNESTGGASGTPSRNQAVTNH